MHRDYGRDLDLNLLRVFAVVAEAGSVTQAAARLYLTQPAVSAALRRLRTAVINPYCSRDSYRRPSRPNNEVLYWQWKIRPFEEMLTIFWS